VPRAHVVQHAPEEGVHEVEHVGLVVLGVQDGVEERGLDRQVLRNGVPLPDGARRLHHHGGGHGPRHREVVLAHQLLHPAVDRYQLGLGLEGEEAVDGVLEQSDLGAGGAELQEAVRDGLGVQQHEVGRHRGEGVAQGLFVAVGVGGQRRGEVGVALRDLGGLRMLEEADGHPVGREVPVLVHVEGVGGRVVAPVGEGEEAAVEAQLRELDLAPCRLSLPRKRWVKGSEGVRRG
jgi:hypothetical protein